MSPARLPLPALLIVSAMALAACSSSNAPAPQPTPVQPEQPVDPDKVCDTGQFSQYVGGPVSTITASPEAKGLAVRVIKPGMAVTMDYSASRLNIELGEDGLVKSVYCG